MKYIHLAGTIDEHMLASLYGDLSDYQGPLEISINSGGGITSIGERILELLNERAEECTLIVLGAALSSAFDIFIGFKGNKRVLTGALGMIHQASMGEFGFYGDGKPTLDTTVRLNMLRHVEARNFAIAKTILTKRELKSYLMGNEIYLEYPRMKKLCNYFVEVVA